MKMFTKPWSQNVILCLKTFSVEVFDKREPKRQKQTINDGEYSDDYYLN